MLQRITGPLPDWASRENPILNYQLRRTEVASRRARLIRAFGVVLLLLALAAGGYAIATRVFTQPAGQHLTERAVNIAFWPMLIIQLGLSISALSFTSGAVGEEQQRQTWDNLRATSHGTELILRVRWVSVFYRLRAALLVVLAVRVLLIFGVLLDLTAFQGRYLDLLIGGITPELPVPVAALLLSLLLTASLLLPLTTIGLDAAAGLLVSTLFQQRVYSLLVQFLMIVVRVALVAGLVWAALQFAGGDLDLPGEAPNVLGWLLMFGFGAVADWSLMYLHLGFSGEVWAIIPYGILIGPGLLLFALGQALLTDWLMGRIVKIAEKRG